MYQITRRHIPVDSNLHSDGSENVESHMLRVLEGQDTEF
jgi:hypothetical protein